MKPQWKICLCTLVLVYWKRTIMLSYGQMVIFMQTSFPESSMAVLLWTGSADLAIESIFTILALLLLKVFNYMGVFLIGLVLCSTGLLLTTLAMNAYQLIIAYGVIYSFGGVFVMNVAQFLVGKVFPKENKFHVFTTSLFNCLNPFGTMTAPLVTMVTHAVGWRITYLIMNIGLIVIGAVCTYVYELHRDNQPDKKINHNVMDKKEDGLAELMVEQPEEMIRPRKTYLFSASIIFFAGSYTTYCFVNSPSFIMTKYALDAGYSHEAASNLQLYFGISEACSRLLLAFLGDNLLKNRLMYTWTLCCLVSFGASIGIAMLATSYNHLVIYMTIIGFVYGPLGAGCYSICGEIFHDGLYINELYTLLNLGHGLGFMSSLIIGGYIYDEYGSFKKMFTFNACMQLSAVLCCMVTLFLKYRQQALMN